MQQHKNNIGVLRLLFASLVILGHAPEQIDGDRHREPLTMMFHTISLGELSVDAFFLLSGFLITKSWISLQSPGQYLLHRALRIYPAFVVAYLLSVFAVGPLVGGHVLTHVAETLVRLVSLQDPAIYPGQLTGLPFPALNGSMWTIAYEFRCYLLVAALGLGGAFAHRRFVLGVTVLLVFAMVAGSFHAFRVHLDSLGAHRRLDKLTGEPWSDIRLTASFMVGACVFLFRDEIFARLNGQVAGVATVLSAALLFQPHLAEAGLITLGAVALFWVAYKAKLGPIQRINDRWDISYGVYLYGWPIADLIRCYDRGITPWLLAALTLPLAAVAGAASWWLIEKWTKPRSRPPGAQHLPPIARSTTATASVSPA